jgi:hypothetical protein
MPSIGGINFKKITNGIKINDIVNTHKNITGDYPRCFICNQIVGYLKFWRGTSSKFPTQYAHVDCVEAKAKLFLSE